MLQTCPRKATKRVRPPSQKLPRGWKKEREALGPLLEVSGKESRTGKGKPSLLQGSWPQAPGPGRRMQETGHSVLSPLCLSLFLSLPQVRSSLGTNILSAMAAFAGTAILLMDFGVTNWVCWQMSQGVINPER